jgi:hypothetical protein
MMRRGKNISVTRGRDDGRAGLISLRLLAAGVFLSFLGLSPAFGQTATYSDGWYVDNTGVVYDSANDEYIAPEQMGGPNEIAGAGITEADYTDDSESVETTLTSPAGQSSTVTSYYDPWYSRAETSLPVSIDPNDTTEREWGVSTVHRYWHEVQQGDPCGPQDPDMPAMPCPQQASLGPARRQFGYYFYTVYSYFPIYIGGALTAYSDVIMTSGGLFGSSAGCRWRRRTCDSNCRNSSTSRIGVPCQPYAQTAWLTYRTYFVRLCFLYDVWGLDHPGVCTPRTWPG